MDYNPPSSTRKLQDVYKRQLQGSINGFIERECFAMNLQDAVLDIHLGSNHHLRRIGTVSYTHLDVYKRQEACNGNQCDEKIFKFHNFDTLLIRRCNGDPLMHTSTDR